MKQETDSNNAKPTLSELAAKPEAIAPKVEPVVKS